MKNVNLTDHFLMAMPTMKDSIFSNTLTYICEHNARGALGLVINRPTDLNLMGLFKQLGILQLSESVNQSTPILFGGPVQMDCGFVLHRPIGKCQSSLALNKEIPNMMTWKKNFMI